MTLSPQPLRGEVWDVEFSSSGRHPAVVLSSNPMNTRLGHLAVIPVTGTRGPEQTHVPLTAEAGLTRYDESYADVTGLRPVDRWDVVTRRGRLSLRELARVEQLLRVYLGL